MLKATNHLKKRSAFIMIGANIKKLRLQHGMTQKNLADKLFVSAQAVSRWENDEVEPSISTILELAKIFGVTADEILGLENKDTKESEENKEDIEKEVKKEQEDSQKSQDTPRQFLALCEKCNSPIYESNKIVRTDGKIFCYECQRKKEEKERSDMLYAAQRRRIYSFVFGAIASLISFIITFSIWSYLSSASAKTTCIVLSIAMFTFISCCILDNNFVGYMFVTISKWSIKAPGLIFTFDLDGCLWFIGMKILFAILGFFIGILMFIFALVFSALCSLFVYPYAIVRNIKRPDDTYL